MRAKELKAEDGEFTDERDAERQHASAYITIRQHTSAYVSIRLEFTGERDAERLRAEHAQRYVCI